ncbi:flagellar biosynthesis protein FlhA [Rubrivirga sp. S365]|uniref:flagellar biosynthesis protein FlhA n=1 Tax=Rubrivirga sp. S365 TaxID=3076080 RepID=UPI0028C74657|nr:flagellar biosynthesis protein FlhA [Rubrivirga sp. S365]MDT7855970.1 flagellar biosynthesis protein FlhA [Rubrivirga sp. S365]
MPTATAPPATPPGARVGTEAVAASGLVLILLVMVVPLPGFLLDLLLTTNIAVSLGVLLTAFYARRPLDFAIFPGLLLITTLFRLSLNVASTRLILGEAKAGALIEAFGSFVVAGNFVVGAIVFLVLVLINFVVITKGSGRIAEVGARFTLDALPGKQMAIDADLGAGLIDEDEARQRRSDVSREADFYGAMDGASKFVRGDAVAGLIITAVNIVGGLVIGATQHGMTMAEAASTFTLLSIGDGLVSQIPALLISTAAGLIVSRASGEGNIAGEVQTQLLAAAVPLLVTGGFMLLLGLMPGLPIVPFWALGIGAIALGRSRLVADRAADAEAARPAPPEAEPEPEPADFLLVDPLELEVGYGLIPLVDPAQGGDLLDRVKRLRQQLAVELGLVIPPVRIRDNVALGANAYAVKLRGNPVGEGEVMPGYGLALLPEGFDGSAPGLKTEDPTFGLPAVWVPERALPDAERQGLTAVEAPAVVTTHLLEVLRTHAHRLLDRQEVSALVDKVKETAPALVGELTPALLSIGDIQKVLKGLLRERVPIRDLVTILEALADHAPRTKNVEVLVEYARAALAATITRQFAGPDGHVHLVVLDPVLEQHLLERAEAGALNASTLGLAPERAQALLEAAEAAAGRLLVDGHPPVLLTSPVLRSTVAAFLAGVEGELAVLSYNDLTADAALDVVDHLSIP